MSDAEPTVLTLGERLDAAGSLDGEAAMDALLAWVFDRGLEPYPAQEEAILELFSDNHVVLKTPTGSGKSLVAIAQHFRDLSLGRHSVYTAPIKALVSEKFLDLCRVFGAERVGLMTGDGTVNPTAPIVCCTAEILSQIALRHGADTPFTGVVMDEFHYYGDRDRGMAWQVPLLTMPHAQFLLMSATLGNTEPIEADLKERTGKDVVVVSSTSRPVPLEFVYSETSADSQLHHLVVSGRAPVYAVYFTQRAAAEHAQALTSTNFCTTEEKAELKSATKSFRFDSPFGPTLRRLVQHGIGLHHAGLLPKYRMLVEQLAQRGMFKVICGTDTLGVGINVPIRTVFFSALCKYDGEETRILSVRHFQQIAGRAGRKGFDDQGTVVAQAPAWVIENRRLATAVAEGKKKKNKVVKKSAPTKRYKHWDEQTFQRLIERAPEALESRFRVDHSLVLNLLQRADETLEDGMAALHALIDTSHATHKQKLELHATADETLAQLLDAGVVVDNGEDALPRYAVDEALQFDFSLHHSLSLFLLHALDQLDPQDKDHALDVLTLVESILEHPRVVLGAQVNKAKGELIAQLKADGVPFEDREAYLEEVTWPKPRAEWIYETFNTYKETRPWLDAAPIRPKAVAREMVESQAFFSNYVKTYRLERSEGVLLRYLSQVHKTMLQNVPEKHHTPAVQDVLAYLRAMLARVDDSLVRTWESLTTAPDPDAAERPVDISEDTKRFRARIRAELHALVRALWLNDEDEAVAGLRHTEEFGWTALSLRTAMKPYRDERGEVLYDGRVRLGWTTQITSHEPHVWLVSQVLVEEDHDEIDGAWSLEGRVDLREDKNPHGPIVELMEVRSP